MSPPATRRAVVVIPTYNEADNIARLLDRLHEVAPRVDVLVVDDRSPDGTAEIVSEVSRGRGGVFLLNGGAKLGLGVAYRSGFAWAIENGYDVIVQMDADFSHPPEKVTDLIRSLEHADLAIGSRYVPGGSVHNWSRLRRLISWAGNQYVRLILGLPVHDATAGFRAFRRQALVNSGAITSTSNGYCFQIETTWCASRRGLEIAEVPIMFVDRQAGSSKMSLGIAVEALVRAPLWRGREMTGRAPHRPSRAREPGPDAGSDYVAA